MKKKLLLGIILAVAIMCLFAISVSAAEITIDGFKYTTIDDKTAKLSSNVSFTGTVAEIPETVEIDGVSYTVTTIGDNIFKPLNMLHHLFLFNTFIMTWLKVLSHAFAQTHCLTDIDDSI